MEKIEILLNIIKNWIWGPPLLLLLIGTGLYLTFILRGVQFRCLGYALKEIFKKRNGVDAEGDISHFDALMTSLAGAIGTGTIVGIAIAVTVGGVGALFWMWITAFVGMATKYAESLLAVKYRSTAKRGEMIGGPMQYMEKGLGWRWLSLLFAVFGSIAAIGTGNLVQVNAIADAVTSVIPIDSWMIGVGLAFLTGFVLIGGVRSIGRVAGVLVPLMALLYVGGGLIILAIHADRIPAALSLIFANAFSGQAAVGAVLGTTAMTVIQMGVLHSVFSNEAGLGISSIAAAAAKTDNPGRQGIISMTGALISTVIVCSITGLVLTVTNVIGQTDASGKLLTGVSMAIAAFNSTLPAGGLIVVIGLILFAYSTVIAWAYYGEKCFEYIFGERSIIFYRILYVFLIIPGTILKMEVVWLLADITNGLMAIPNLIALIALSGIIVQETHAFLKIRKQEALSLA